MSAWRVPVFQMVNAQSSIQIEKMDEGHICFALEKGGEVAHVQLVEHFA